MGEAAALIAAFTWSGTSVAMAHLTVTVRPVAMSALRLLVASLLLPFVLIVSGQAGQINEAPGSAILAMVGSGLLAYAIGDTMYIAALGRLGIQRAFTITMALFIILTVAGGIVLLGEDFTWGQAAGGILVGAGIYLITRERTTAEDTVASVDVPTGVTEPLTIPPYRSHAAGYVMVVLVGVFWAAATLWLAEGRGDLDSISASMIRTPSGAIGMLAFGWVTSRTALTAPFSDRRQIGGIIAIGIVGTLFGSLLYVYAVGEAGAARTSILNACAPLMALPLSFFILKERITRLGIIGTLICVSGIVLVVV